MRPHLPRLSWLIVGVLLLAGNGARTLAKSAIAPSSAPGCGAVISTSSIRPDSPRTLTMRGDPNTLLVSERSGRVLVMSGQLPAPQGNVPECAAVILTAETGQIVRQTRERGVWAAVDDPANRFVLLVAGPARHTTVLFLDTWSGRTVSRVILTGFPDRVATYDRRGRVYVTTLTDCPNPTLDCRAVTFVLDTRGRQVGKLIEGAVRVVDQVHGRLYLLSSSLGAATLTALDSVTGARLWSHHDPDCGGNELFVVQRTGTIWLTGYLAPGTSAPRVPSASRIVRPAAMLGSGPPVLGTGLFCLVSGSNGHTQRVIRVPGVTGVGLELLDEPARLILVTESGVMGSAVVARRTESGRAIAVQGPVSLSLPHAPAAVDPASGYIYYVSSSDMLGLGHSAISVLNPYIWRARVLARLGAVQSIAVVHHAKRVIVGQTRQPGVGAISLIAT